MEADILWGVVSATPENDYQEYRNIWLRLAKNIGQAGKPVVLCGSAIPDQFEACPERRYFSTLHYLAIVCKDECLKERLQQRPQWRKSSTDAVTREMLRFNRWLKAHAATTHPPMTLHDNSQLSIPESTRWIAQWIRERR